MCQLLGMNCSTPTDFNFSFRGFCKRGGETDVHSHGWGMGIYEGKNNGLREFKDKEPAAKSLIAKFVTEQYPIQTLNMLAHIRYATQGEVSLENVHPFSRELWGINWCFAHNGEVPKYNRQIPYVEYPMLGRCSNRIKDVFYHPVGNTDSEATFCMILNALRAEFTELPTLPLLYETLQRLCAQLVEGDEETTILNFLLGCGQYTLFAYSWPGKRPGSKVWNGLHYTVRKPPFSTATLKDCDYSVDFSKCTGPNDRVAVIATKPLTTDENWIEFRKGQLLMFDCGLAYSELYDCREIEQEGRGLFSNTFSKNKNGRNDNDKSISPSSSNKRPRISGSSSTATLACNTCSPPCSPRHHDIPSELRSLVNKEIRVMTRRQQQQQQEPNDENNLISNDFNSNVVCWAENGVDLGCGTGNSGVAFRSCVQKLTGVDLSPEMIDRAKQRDGVYDELLCGNVECVLRKQPTKGKRCTNKNHGALTHKRYDLIFACNVFVYIKDLRNVFYDISQILSTNGIFAFSAEFFDDDSDDGEEGDGKNMRTKEKEEEKADPPYEMQSCARYAHKRWYLEDSAREFGFITKVFKASPLQRKHNGHNVYGCLAVLTK